MFMFPPSLIPKARPFACGNSPEAAISSSCCLRQLCESLPLCCAKTLPGRKTRIIRRIKLLLRLAELVTPKQTVTVFTGTMEADNRILECAVGLARRI